VENHHHIYTGDNNKIEDYVNDELDHLLMDFFKKNSIPNLKIESIKVSINGKYLK
jgi:Fe2+ or Zn2+ uptake regulation protein